MKISSWGLASLIIFTLFLGIVAGMAIFRYHSPHVSRIAPTYALDCVGSLNDKAFVDFWQEVIKHTTFTIDDKPVEITGIQIFYKGQPEFEDINWTKLKTVEDWTSFSKSHHIAKFIGSITNPDGSVWVVYLEDFTYGNITYYPLGVENSQTYVTPTPAPFCGYLADCEEQCPSPCHYCSHYDSDYDGLSEGHCLDMVSTPTPSCPCEKEQ